MKKPVNHTKRPIVEGSEDNFSYPGSEDIFENYKKESEIDPENPDMLKEPNQAENTWNEKDFDDDKTGEDLDVPGSEMDDEQENNGSEDEENNYYSIGGDNHNDLEESRE